jgi:hypothetical protein
MKIQKKTVVIAVIGTLVLTFIVFAAITLYAGSRRAKASIIVQYYRALSNDDPTSIDALKSTNFIDQLGIVDLKRGSYELYDLGESSAGVLRYIIVLDGDNKKRRAILAEMSYSKRGLQRQIESIRMVEQGSRLKE